MRIPRNCHASQSGACSCLQQKIRSQTMSKVRTNTYLKLFAGLHKCAREHAHLCIPVCTHMHVHTQRLRGSVRVIEIERLYRNRESIYQWSLNLLRQALFPNFFMNLSMHPSSIHWLLFLRTPLKSFIPIGLLRIRPTIGSKRTKDIWSTLDQYLYIPYMSQSDLWNAKRKVILLYGGRSRSRASSPSSESRYLNPVPATSPYFYMPPSNCTNCWCEVSKHGDSLATWGFTLLGLYAHPSFSNALGSLGPSLSCAVHTYSSFNNVPAIFSIELHVYSEQWNKFLHR